MRTTMLALAAMTGLVLFGGGNAAQANHQCGGYGGGYGGYSSGYGGYYGGYNSYYAPSYGYGYYPRSYNYSPGYYGGYGGGGYCGGRGVSVYTPSFGFRYRW